MNHIPCRRQILPSSLLFALCAGLFNLSGCALLPFDELATATNPASETPSRAEAAEQVPVEEPTANAIVEDSLILPEPEPEVLEIEPPLPEIDLSYYGVPEPEAELAIFELCQEVGNKLGSVSVENCLNQNLEFNGGLSVLGRPLAMREFPPLPDKEPLGRVLLIGGIHGDEFSSISIVFKWMDILEKHHSGIFHWLFVPVSNPDGLLESQSQRQNFRGVDLNRNFPSRDWNELALAFWQDKTASNTRRYPGPSAGSEPEVVWLVEQIEKFQPDVIISVHAPYHLVDYDGPPEAPEKLGDLQLSKLGVFPGSLGNYAGIDLTVPVVTIELPYAGIMPSPEQISMMWTDLVAWLIEEQSKPEG